MYRTLCRVWWAGLPRLTPTKSPSLSSTLSRCCSSSSSPPSLSTSLETIPKSEMYFKAAGRVHREDRCTYHGTDMHLLLPGVDDVKNPMTNIKNPQVIEDLFPIECDVLVVGGGIMGASVSYWLAMMRTGANIVCVERDLTYTQASTVLSVGGIRQQFSLPENIAMSMYGAEFLRDSFRHLCVYGEEPPAIGYHPQGYLFLASTEDGARDMEISHGVQRRMGAQVSLMSPEKLKSEFPWLNVNGILLGSFGLENEGWFDPWGLLNGFKFKAKSEGARFLQGDVLGFKFMDPAASNGIDRIGEAYVRRHDGLIQPLRFSRVVNAAGAWSGRVARLCKVGTDDMDDPNDVRTVKLPVEPRKRFVYVLHCPDGPGLDCPMVVDPSGLYFRREGLAGFYLCGISPKPEDEPSVDNLDVDYEYFNEVVWPLLAERVPAFEKCKVKNAWAGYYDYNFYDENCVIGGHPYYRNVFFCTGFSGHGIQQAAAAGKELAELIFVDKYKDIDLSRLDFRRFLVGAKMMETNIV